MDVCTNRFVNPSIVKNIKLMLVVDEKSLKSVGFICEMINFQTFMGFHPVDVEIFHVPIP